MTTTSSGVLIVVPGVHLIFHMDADNEDTTLAVAPSNPTCAVNSVLDYTCQHTRLRTPRYQQVPEQSLPACWPSIS